MPSLNFLTLFMLLYFYVEDCECPWSCPYRPEPEPAYILTFLKTIPACISLLHLGYLSYIPRLFSFPNSRSVPVFHNASLMVWVLVVVVDSYWSSWWSRTNRECRGCTYKRWLSIKIWQLIWGTMYTVRFYAEEVGATAPNPCTVHWSSYGWKGHEKCGEKPKWGCRETIVLAMVQP